MVHHGDMEKLQKPSRIEALGCSLIALGLGAYLSSGVDHLALQVVMFSFPPASLLMALRREKTTIHRPQGTIALPEPAMAHEVPLNYDFDILSRAS